MGVPLDDVRQRNSERVALVLEGFDSDLVGVLSRLPYNDLDWWLDLVPGGNSKGVPNALGPVYDASLMFLRREIADLNLPYPREAVDGIAPENNVEMLQDLDDSSTPIDLRFVQLTPEEAERCAIVLRFVAFTVMKARDRGTTMGQTATRAWIAGAFLRVTDVALSCIATRILLGLLITDFYVPPFSTLDIVLESALLVPCGNSSTPQTICPSLIQFVENDELASKVVSKYVDPREVQKVVRQTLGPDAIGCVAQARLSSSLKGPEMRAEIVELQIYSLCALFVLTSPSGFDELTSKRAPSALAAIADITRAQDTALSSRLKVAVADTLWCVLGTQVDDEWPEAYALRVGINAQLAAIKDASGDHLYLLRLLSAVSYGVTSVGSFLPGMLNIATDSTTPADIKLIAGNVMNLVVRDEDVTSGALRSHNAYSRLIPELSRSVIAVTSASTDKEAQFAAGLAEVFIHLFLYWINDARTPELEHALINSEFFDYCADLSAPSLRPFVRSRTSAISIHVASLILDHSRIEPLVERGTAERFVLALHGVVDDDLPHLKTVTNMAAKLWDAQTDEAYHNLLKHIYQRVLSSPWMWVPMLRDAFVPLLRRSNTAHDDMLMVLNEALRWALVENQDLPPKAIEDGETEGNIKGERKFRENAVYMAFDLLTEIPMLDSGTVTKLFAAATLANVRNQILQFYAAQNLDGSVSRFLCDRAQTPQKASFLLAIDKIALASNPFTPGRPVPSHVCTYTELMPMILENTSAGSIEAAFDQKSSIYSSALLFVLKDTKFFSDDIRMQLICTIMANCEQMYSKEPGSGNIRQLLLFLRDITSDWRSVGTEAALSYNSTLISACHILCKAFAYKDEPTQTLTFSVLRHVFFSGRRQAVSLSVESNREIDLVISAALEFEGLRARVVVPVWFGKREDQGRLTTRWKNLFAEVARLDPAAVLNLANSVSDRDFSRNVDAFLAAGDVAVSAMREGMMGDFLELVAGIADRLRFPWISFESISWPGAHEAFTLVMKQFEGVTQATELAALFGPLSALMEHIMCHTLLDSHEKGLSAEEQLSSVSRSPLGSMHIKSLKLMDAMKTSLKQLSTAKVPKTSETDETAHNIISGIAWLLVRFIDCSPEAAQYIIHSGLFHVLIECTSSEFRQHETSEISEVNDRTLESMESNERGRGSYKTVDSAVAKMIEQSLRAITHAISTSGILGERKIAMLVDTPRVAGFNQIEHIQDVKSLILRRPDLRHIVVQHIVRTSRGLVPASDTPNAETTISPLDEIALNNVEAMIHTLVPAYLSEDLRMAEVAGDALVDLVCSVGAARDAVSRQYPDIVLQVIRKFGPRHAPDDPRLGGSPSDPHILETSVRFLSALTVQGLDDPFDISVCESLMRSSEMLFTGIIDIMQHDVMSDILAGRKERAAFQMYFLASVLLRSSTIQNRVELPAWSQIDPDENVPPFVRAMRSSQVLTIYLETYAHLDPAALAVRMFRVEVLAVLEEYTILEGYDWPHRKDATIGQDEESDDNEQQNDTNSPQQHRESDQIPIDRDVFRNSVLGDIDDENLEEEEYMDIEDEDDMESVEELNSDELGDELSNETGENMSSEDEDESDEGDAGDRMSIVRFASNDEENSSSDEGVYLLGGSSGEDDSDPTMTPEVIETVFSSEEGDDINHSSSDSDSELDEFDPESSDADTQMSSDVDIVFEGFQPVSGFELMNGILLRFSNELEMLDEPDIDDSDTEDVQPYASSALFSTGIPQGVNESPVLSENDGLLAWWNENTLESSEVSAQIDSFLKDNVPQLSGSSNDSAIAAVRYRQQHVEPSMRPFGAKRLLDTEKVSATVARMLYSVMFEQERIDLSQVLLQLLQFRDGRDSIVHFVMGALFEASVGNVASSYTKLCSVLGTSAYVPRETTPALVCANSVRFLCDILESELNSTPDERSNHDRLCRRLGRCLLRAYGPKLVELLAMPQICQNRRLLHNSAVLVLHVLSITGSRRFDSSSETLAQLTKVLGLRECTSESFSVLTEIIQKHLRTEVLLPNVIRETRRARSSLLVLLPAVAKLDVACETVDAFATEQVKLLRLMSLLNRVYEPQQVLAALKSVNLLPLWHSVGIRLNNGTLDGPTNGRGFASGVSLLESFALALSAAVRWKAPVPDTHPALTKYAQWIRNYLRSFMVQRKALINELLRARPNLYLGPMGEMARTLKLFDFQSKEKWFRAKVSEDASRVRAEVSGELRLSVRRQCVLEDSFASLYGLEGPILRSPMFVKFENEEAVDAGGVSREWLELIAREILNPAYALFTPTQEVSSVYQVNRDSGVNSNHLDYFLVVGRVIGRAIYDGRMVGLYFSRIIYKYLLGRPHVTLADMEAIDEQYYKSLVWMLEMDVTDVIEETFSVQGVQFGQPFTVDLIENGRNIPVTESNKQEYVKRIVEYKLVESVKDQLEALRRGFNDVISPELVELFDEQELELLLCGLPTIRVDDWRANTTYVGYASDSPQIRWFWTAVASFSTEERAKLLQFSTGTSRVPVHGFAHLESSNAGTQFQIHKEHGSTSRWPSSHTCMNQINLPAYESYKKLRAMLLRAIVEGSEGFGFI